MKDRTIAVNLAKNVFEVGISDRPGHVEKRYRLSRSKFLKCFVDQSPSRVVMEACGSSHYWARETKVVIALFGWFAEVEPHLISERTKEGLAAGQAKG